ncbi:LysR substrate-binding domain-containing protein [Pelagibius sp. Alg239-R121]|uniref:LysR substrate-binding domain-containing protein n=1 Tax=Pelagibius sp. Alg239-R121 TaxID=2993448 RepID=UPI0024A61EE8|nr:LysR substrate-binding domain-containing protein [Pelagibius sp. Alg239-R121]
MAVDPPRPRAIPLKALRAFEAAARHESFVLAGEELAVTPGAIAQQVKLLEEWAGCRLFERKAQGVSLSEPGHAALPALKAAFDALGAAAQDLRRAGMPGSIRIAALPSVAQLWLSPRLPALRAAFPELLVSVTALEPPPNLLRESFDLALFFLNQMPQDVECSVLSEDRLFPVCTPELAQKLKRAGTPSHDVLLHDETWRDDWPEWLRAARAHSGKHRHASDGRSGPVFSLYSLAVQAAVDGAGLLIGHQPLVESALARGRLVQAFNFSLPSDKPLCALYPKDSAESGLCKQVVDWLKS